MIQNVASLTNIFALILIIVSSCKNLPKEELNSAYSDDKYKQSIQTIPGKLHCEYYDLGGEGIAYHDTDSVNNGSGKLNKGNDYLSAFRKGEAVDISYTKFHNNADNSKFNLVQPQNGQLYIGWTEPGEWTRYMVEVSVTGTYQVGLMYTANQDGKIEITTNTGGASGPLEIKSTYDPNDTIAWRQWHHWNFAEELGEIELKSGIQLLTLHTLEKGQMNYDYLSFELKKNN
ncbi:MAG: carbohydrate-binding protein [Eudoraea sp.]|uniref:carbohydrate-binding protein n=2 Tax=Eudoraea sp. TaxID=1979955 RepID=UPI003C7209FD